MKESVLEFLQPISTYSFLWCVWLFFFSFRKPQTPEPSPKKKSHLKIATLIVLGKRNLCSLKKWIFFFNPELKEDFLHHCISFTNSLNKINPSPFRTQSLLYSVALLPSSEVCLDNRRSHLWRMESPLLHLKAPGLLKKKETLFPKNPCSQIVFFFPYVSPENTTLVQRLFLVLECDSCYFIES